MAAELGKYLEADIAIISKVDTKQRAAEHSAIQELNELVATLRLL